MCYVEEHTTTSTRSSCPVENGACFIRNFEICLQICLITAEGTRGGVHYSFLQHSTFVHCRLHFCLLIEVQLAFQREQPTITRFEQHGCSAHITANASLVSSNEVMCLLLVSNNGEACPLPHSFRATTSWTYHLHRCSFRATGKLGALHTSNTSLV